MSFCLYWVTHQICRQALEAERDDRHKEVDDLRQHLAAVQAESAEQAASMDAQLQAAQERVDSIAHRAEVLQVSAASSLRFPAQLVIEAHKSLAPCCQRAWESSATATKEEKMRKNKHV